MTPLIKTIHTAETLALALERQQRWVDGLAANATERDVRQARDRHGERLKVRQRLRRNTT